MWRWNDRMRRVSKAEKQLHRSARHPTENENNKLPQLCWPSKPWNSEAEKLISEDPAVSVNWVKVSQVLPLWVNIKRTVILPWYEIRDMSVCLLVSLALSIFIRTNALYFSLLQVSLTFSQKGFNYYYFILFILFIVSALAYRANKIWVQNTV